MWNRTAHLHGTWPRSSAKFCGYERAMGECERPLGDIGAPARDV
jgi:hypothetical protein